LRVFDRLIIGIGTHHGKAPVFEGEERAGMLRDMLNGVEGAERASIVLFSGLLVDAARQYGAQAILRGLRDGTDLDYETQMAGMNGIMAPEIETVFLAASPGFSHIAATFVRQIAALGGDVSAFVPPAVHSRFKTKFPPRQLDTGHLHNAQGK
jgi:pantetheine-phosphate adenylyltransferase